MRGSVTASCFDPVVEERHEDLAWAAGFFDAEGCFNFTKAGRYASVSIGQTDQGLLARFQSIVRVGKIDGPYRRTHPGQWAKKEQFRFRVYDRKSVVHIVELLWPWLGDVKRAQAETMLHRAHLDFQRQRIPQRDP